MSHKLAIGFVADFVKYTDRLREEFINSGVYLKDGCILVGNYLRVTGVRIVDFPTLEVYTGKLYNLSDSDFDDLGLGILSNAKDCYIDCCWDKYSYLTFVNFVIRDYSSKKLSIVNEKFMSIGFAELENGGLLFNCGQYKFTTKNEGKIYLGDINKGTDGNFLTLDLENSFFPIIINKPMLTDLLGERELSFCYAFGRGFYLALGSCIVWTNIVGDSIIYKGSIFSYSDYRDIFNTHHLFCNIDLFKEIGYLFNITRNLICIDDVSILFRYETNKEFVIPSGCKYFICDTYDGLSNYSSVIFPPSISFIKFKYNKLGKYGDKKKYSNCTFYFSKNTGISLFVDVLFNQFLASYIYKQYNKEDSVTYSKDFRNVIIFGKFLRTTMTKDEFEINKAKLLKDIKTAEDFVKHFKKVLPVKIKFY